MKPCFECNGDGFYCWDCDLSNSDPHCDECGNSLDKCEVCDGTGEAPKEVD